MRGLLGGTYAPNGSRVSVGIEGRTVCDDGGT